METNKRLEVREVKETKKEEPEYTPLHSSSHKNNTLKDYHTLSEKYRVANRYKNLMIGIVVAIVMWYNDWICVDSILLKALYAGGMVLLTSLLCGAVDEVLMEE